VGDGFDERKRKKILDKPRRWIYGRFESGSNVGGYPESAFQVPSIRISSFLAYTI
jgi:hypothetical protein